MNGPVVGEFFGILLAFALGFATVQALIGRSSRVPLLLKSALALSVGFTISSLLWFVIWATASSVSILLPVSYEVLMVAGFGLLIRRPRLKRPRGLGKIAHASRDVVVLLGVTLLVAILTAVYFKWFYNSDPHGGWDAWAMWNMHARALHRGGGHLWKYLFPSIWYSHGDYPLNLPLTVARLWFFAGNESTAVPMVVQVLYVLAGLGLLGASLRLMKGTVASLLSVCVLLASTGWLSWAARQYADVPHSVYLLGALVCCVVSDYLDEPRLLIVGGLSAASAAWNKNEGSVYVVCLVLAYAFVSAFRQAQRRNTIRNLGLIAAGALIPMLVVIIYKTKNPAHSDTLGWLLTKAGWLRILDAHRVMLILSASCLKIWDAEGARLLFTALAAYFVLVGLDENAETRRRSLLCVVAIILMSAGYFFLYVTCAFVDDGSVRWLVNTTADRLFFQLWPSLLLAVFLGSHAPLKAKMSA